MDDINMNVRMKQHINEFEILLIGERNSIDHLIGKLMTIDSLISKPSLEILKQTIEAPYWKIC